MPIRAILLDLFDTLVDLSLEGLPPVTAGGRTFPSTAGALHAHVAARRRIGLDEFVEALYANDKALREPRSAEGRELPTLERFEGLVRRLGIEDPELPRLLTHTHMDLLRGQVRVPGHHPELLGSLRARARLALCSNFSHSETALRVLEEGGLRPHLDAIVVSDAVGWRKPRPEIFRAALASMDVAPEEALHVGDSLAADVAGAARLGLRTVWLTRRVADPERALAAHTGPAPDAVLTDLAELPALLERL